MASKPNVSIAMATYNGERFLREQLDSTARQTLSPYELVVTDDGSTDGTPGIIEEFAKRAPFQVRLYRNDGRLGYADNFLKAASLCRGDLIAFSDQDDLWLNEKLARCAASFEDESVMLVVHSARVVDEGLKPLGWLTPKIDRDAITPPLTSLPWLQRGFAGFAMMFRSSLPLLFNRLRPEACWGQTEPMVHDQWVYFLSDVLGKTASIREPLALYRRHAATATSPAQLPVAETTRLSLSAGAEAYAKIAKLAARWAAFLDQAASSLPEKWRSSACKGAEHYRYVEELLLERSRIYRADEHFWNRFSALVRLMARGQYGRQSSVGVGFRSGLKDALVGVLRIDRVVRKSVV